MTLRIGLPDSKWSIAICSISILLGYPLFVLTQSKMQYVIFMLFSVLFFARNSSRVLIYEAIPYLIIVVFSAVGNLMKGQAMDGPFFLNFISLIVCPFIFGRKNTALLDNASFRWGMDFAVLLYAVGLMLQIAGIGSEYLYTEMVLTDGVYHERFGSLAGGSLALGFNASIAAFTCLDRVLKGKKNVKDYLFLALSVFCIVLSYARRYYVLFFLTVGLFYLIKSKILTTVSVKKIIALILVVCLVVVFGFFNKDSLIVFRIVSLFDFSGDASNLLRLEMWLQAFQMFYSNMFIGAGVGSTGAVGRADLILNFDYISCESFYLKMFAETGLMGGIIFLYIAYRSFRVSVRALSGNVAVVPALFVIFTLIESISGTAMEGPFAAAIFWCSLGNLAAVELK